MANFVILTPTGPFGGISHTTSRGLWHATSPFYMVYQSNMWEMPKMQHISHLCLDNTQKSPWFWHEFWHVWMLKLSNLTRVVIVLRFVLKGIICPRQCIFSLFFLNDLVLMTRSNLAEFHSRYLLRSFALKFWFLAAILLQSRGMCSLRSRELPFYEFNEYSIFKQFIFSGSNTETSRVSIGPLTC